MSKTSSQSRFEPTRLKYADETLDRAAIVREDPERLQRALEHCSACTVAVWRNQSLVTGLETARPGAVRHGIEFHRHASEVVFLGLDNDVPLFAADYSHLEEPAVARLLGDRFIDLRRVGPLLEDGEAALLAYARGMLYWHRNHRFCGRCGTATESQKGGHLRACTNPDCRRLSFPRTDPAVIVLVEHPGGDGGPPRCLLGRSPHFLPGMYSTLAGFVEPGESLEQTVRREVIEESGVRVGDVRYLASQPWPFPSSLMIGFHATAASTEIRLHDQELEDARWFSADELLAVKARGEDETFCLPRKDSIARFLVETWLQALKGKAVQYRPI
ncbi:MAG: NAD(+) diphosphatase [Wenzhouxiangellaceae bacterium]